MPPRALLPLAALLLAACGAALPGAAPAPATVVTRQAPTDAPPAPTDAPPAPTDAPPAPTDAPPAPTDVPPAPTDAPPAELPALALAQLVGGLDRPLYLTHAGDGSGRLFVVEQAGVVKIIRDGAVLPEPLLDIRDLVGSKGNEQGLLSIAFHPRFAESGLAYLNYTDAEGDTVVARVEVAGDRADPASLTTLLTVDQPYANHNGGLLKFGPDGYLYIGMGDGGSGGDPENRAQDLGSLLGKLLRIDVDGGDPYAIPPDNPYAAGGGRPEIWALGLRNPWRFSFDRATGDMFIGDVGQNKYEEVSFQPAGQGGLNYGWRQVEGSHCYVEGCDTSAYTAPVAEYPHEQGCSVTGGYVYRGAALAQLQGAYLFGDYCTGTIWALTRAGGAWASAVALDTDAQITSFGEDEAGELYLVDRDGSVSRIVAAGG